MRVTVIQKVVYIIYGTRLEVTSPRRVRSHKADRANMQPPRPWPRRRRSPPRRGPYESGCRAARHAVASRTRRGALPSSAAMKMRRRAQRRPYTFSGKRVSCDRRIRIAQGRLLGCKTTPTAHCTTNAACHPCQPEPRRSALRATRHAERCIPAVLYRHISSERATESGGTAARVVRLGMYI